MLFIVALATFIWFITSCIVVADMFRKRIAIGCLGLFMFPILPFIWVLKWYSGRRRVVGLCLYLSAIVAIACFSIEWRSAARDLEPFFLAAAEESGLMCSIKTISYKGGMKRFVVVSVPKKRVEIKYADVDEMVQRYRERFVESLTNDYPLTMINDNRAAIIIAIPTPSGFYACYQIESPGRITKAWHDSGADL
jgi:hypothetical protein